MALDHNAGQKRSVGLARNLFASTNMPQVAETQVVSAPAVKTEPASTYNHKVEAPVSSPARTKKISFLADPRLEERFRKARLKAGFDKLEDAYNEAIKTFCDLVDAGKIDRF
jgi:hypothetical protein